VGHGVTEVPSLERTGRGFKVRTDLFHRRPRPLRAVHVDRRACALFQFLVHKIIVIICALNHRFLSKSDPLPVRSLPLVNDVHVADLHR
jgi:hypothetical protein